MSRRILKINLVFIFVLAFVLPAIFGFTQMSPEEERAMLEKELKILEEKIAQYEKDITKTKQEKKTLQNQISLLKSKIQQLDLQIKKNNLMIQDLSLQIKDTQNSIEKTSLKIEDSKQKLATILRTIYEEDQKSLLEILISEPKLSNFFDNLMALKSLNQTNQELLEEIKKLKSNLEEQKTKLDEEKEDLGRVLKVQTLQKQQSEESKKEQERILKMTEAQYQQYLKEKQEMEKKAAEIRRRIFELAQIPIGKAPSYEEAYQLASWAGSITGVRPALILGVLEIESAIGKNVGQCNCKGCRYPNLTYKDVMPSSQWASFEAICQELGLDPNNTPVSCYVDGGAVQWGGAMGPAQFMPNTWLNLGYKQRIENITGVKPANPWRVKDAFLATALYLADFNASSQNRQHEIGAVTAYLCGTSVMTTGCRLAGGGWYVSKVMEKADQWQQWIDQGVFNKK